jgi:hypothetical protein
MIESIFQTFLLLGTFDIILISVSIANYAISASYLGRETRLTRSRMEKRKQKLNERVKELQAKGLPIGELKKETKEAEDDIKGLSNRLFLLSWLGAVVLPSIFFIVSLVIAVVGMNSDIFAEFAVNSLMIWAIGSLGVGFTFLLIVIYVIDSAARNIPIPEFEVFFKNHAKSISIKPNATEIISFFICNNGEDIAEDAEIFVVFPNTFKAQESPYYSVQRTSSEGHYPDTTCIYFTFNFLHIGSTQRLPIRITAPSEKKMCDIIVDIRERKTEASKHHLSIEVVD